MLVDILMIVAGLVLLFFGGEGLIKGAVSLARQFGLSQLLVSAVIVGFGTSMPEMTVSVGAALKGAPDIALGNVIGSNIANILLIIGLSALLCPLFVGGNAIKRDTVATILAALALCLLALLGHINAIAGFMMLATLAAYIVWSYRLDKNTRPETVAHIEQDIEGAPLLSARKALLYAIAGLVLLIAGAHVLVEGAVAIARMSGLSDAVIGLTIVAIGTSLPELATAMIAAYRRHSDVVIGNILGSNIFNIFAILGVTAIVSPIPFSGQMAQVDVWIMLAVTAFLAIYLFNGIKVGKKSGAIMLLIYLAYIFWLYSTTIA